MRGAAILYLFAVCLTAACVNTTSLSSGCDGGPPHCGGTIASDCPPPPPRCDPATLKCAPCLPQNDNCAAGTKCLADGTGSYRCATNCISASDCPQFGLTISCCSSVCSDLTSDPANCGTCGNACPAPANGKPGCSKSVCGLGTCNTGYADCNKNSFDGCEVDTTSDARNCGACGTICTAYQNGTSTCTAGKCVYTCTAGYADCNNSALDGCETTTSTDVQNCGACKSTCLSLPNATSSCTAGACLINTCVNGHLDCDHQNPDGCEVNSSTDPMNCGACGTVCGALLNAVSGCVSGACGIASCNANYGDCNGLAADGCETSLKADPKNCGGCAHGCNALNANSICTAGACVITGCNAGFADCNKNPADGCEANLGSDPLNCGGCGTTCSFPNANPSCTNGTCSFSSCNANYGDCDKMLANGCEINTQADLKNCGGCGNTCSLVNATQKCALGACAILMCNANYADCDKMAADGCEVSTLSDVKNCGGCAMACSLANATPVCTFGACAISTCNTNYADCDKVAANGCEVSTQTDANNCGKCGTVCANGQSCINGVCGAATTTIGHATDGGSNQQMSANLLWATAISVTKQVTLLRFGLFPRSAGDTLQMALYASNGTPTTLLANTNAVQSVQGQQEIPSTTNPVLAPGTYWVGAVFPSSSLNVAATLDQNSAIAYVTPGSPLPDPFKPQGSGGTGIGADFYIVVQ